MALSAWAMHIWRAMKFKHLRRVCRQRLHSMQHAMQAGMQMHVNM
jgi:hypothetical protein